ncbi:MAG: nucleoside triphosphate pyrophosphohydrolase family protein [Pseudonocardiales bacterium]|nr:nucleoside triphosphate pyrophosphohydrolase family protein [Pseudonocardiales bacterium]
MEISTQRCAMEFSEYQRKSAKTDQKPGEDLEAVVVHLLGLIGEAGSVAEAYKKKLRDRDAHGTWKVQLREELGDIMWYVATVARKVGLDLDDIAAANLAKTCSRWLRSGVDQLDAVFPASEQLPRRGRYDFVPSVSPMGRSQITVLLDGASIGDRLTDASHVDDGYRFHDVFHLAYAITLGWSPVTRALLGRKRRSAPNVDENEDGGRAIVIGEGIAALTFAYGAMHRHLDGIQRLDQGLLDTIMMISGALEVGTRTAADWEYAILIGHKIFRQLMAHNGGGVEFDADQGRMTFIPPTR